MKTKHLLPAAILSAFFLLPGCTSLTSMPLQKWKQDHPTERPPEGVIYCLPKVQFEVALKRQLTECQEDWTSDEAGEKEIKVKLTAEVTSQTVQDMKHVYIIDYRNLAGATKTTDLTIQLTEQGLIEDVNAEITDKTDVVIQKTISGITKAVLVGAGIPPEAMIAKEKEVKKPLVCNEPTREALKKLTDLKKEIERIDERLAKLKKPASQKPSSGTSSGKKVTKTAPKTGNGENPELEKEIKELTAKRKKNQNERIKELKNLTHTQVYLLEPSSASDSSRILLDPNDDILHRWFDKNVLDGLSKDIKFPDGKPLENYACRNNALTNSFLCESTIMPIALRAVFALRVPGGWQVQEPLQEEVEALVYRQPALGTILICAKLSCLAGDGKPMIPENERLYSKQSLVPQAGVLATLPFTNKMFQNNTLHTEFHTSGGIKKLTQETKKAPAEVAAGSLEQSVDAWARYQDAKRKERETKLRYETDTLKAEKDKLEVELGVEQARKELEDFRATSEE